MSDASLGRDLASWLRLAEVRAARLQRLVKLGAPPIIISGAVRLMRSALDAIDALAGDAEADRAVLDHFAAERSPG